MTSPAHSDGEGTGDDQSETVGPPVGDESPPVRTKTAPVVLAVLLALTVALTIALFWTAFD